MHACLSGNIYIFELEQSFWVGIGGFYRLAVALKAGPSKEMVSWKVNWQKGPPGFGLPVLCNRWIVSSLYKCEFATLWVANKHCGTHPFVEGIGKWTYGQHLDRWGSFLLEVLSVESSWLHTQWGQWDLMPMPGGRSMNIRVSQKKLFLNFVCAVEPLVRTSSQSPRNFFQRYRPINDTLTTIWNFGLI